MAELPRGGLIGKTVCLIRSVSGLKIGIFGANASFFLVLAVFPGLLVLLGLLRYTPLEAEQLILILEGVLPGAFLPAAEELILLTYDSFSATELGLSAFTALWSASRGMYGLITGLNRVYDVGEGRGYIRRRLLSVVYTFAFLLILLLTLGLYGFGARLSQLERLWNGHFFLFLTQAPGGRFLLLLMVQSLLFSLLYRVLPGEKRPFSRCIPGAVVASLGWLGFSQLYSLYVEHAGTLSRIYGSVYGLALSMLWLYFCICIFFFGAVVNRLLEDGKI